MEVDVNAFITELKAYDLTLYIPLDNEGESIAIYDWSDETVGIYGYGQISPNFKSIDQAMGWWAYMKMIFGVDETAG